MDKQRDQNLDFSLDDQRIQEEGKFCDQNHLVFMTKYVSTLQYLKETK